jgi:hypothetical protein
MEDEWMDDDEGTESTEMVVLVHESVSTRDDRAEEVKEVRMETAHLMKGCACLLMIQVHVLELFIQPAPFRGSLMGTMGMFLGGPPVAPVFLAVMGWFLGKSKKSALQLCLRG